MRIEIDRLIRAIIRLIIVYHYATKMIPDQDYDFFYNWSDEINVYLPKSQNNLFNYDNWDSIKSKETLIYYCKVKNHDISLESDKFFKKVAENIQIKSDFDILGYTATFIDDSIMINITRQDLKKGGFLEIYYIDERDCKHCIHKTYVSEITDIWDIESLQVIIPQTIFKHKTLSNIIQIIYVADINGNQISPNGLEGLNIALTTDKYKYIWSKKNINVNKEGKIYMILDKGLTEYSGPARILIGKNDTVYRTFSTYLHTVL